MTVMVKKLRLPSSLLFSALLLGACGGGGSERVDDGPADTAKTNTEQKDASTVKKDGPAPVVTPPVEQAKDTAAPVVPKDTSAPVIVDAGAEPDAPPPAPEPDAAPPDVYIPTPPPAPYTASTVGKPQVPGFVDFLNTGYVVKGAGIIPGFDDPIPGMPNKDSFEFVQRKMSGQWQVMARVVEFTGTGFSKAGLMFRDSLEDTLSPHSFVHIGGKYVAFQFRLAPTDPVMLPFRDMFPPKAPVWLRLRRGYDKGAKQVVLTGEASLSDDVIDPKAPIPAVWSISDPVRFSGQENQEFYGGIAISGFNNDQLASARVDKLTYDNLFASDATKEWRVSNIESSGGIVDFKENAGQPGNLGAGTFKITGGSTVAAQQATKENGAFAFRRFEGTGDYALSAEVDLPTGGADGAKAGISVRSNANSGTYIGAVITFSKDGTVEFVYTASSGKRTTPANTGKIKLPATVKKVELQLQKIGIGYRAAYREAGTQTWKDLGSGCALTIPGAYLGLLVNSGDQNQMTTATYGAVKIESIPLGMYVQQCAIQNDAGVPADAAK